MLGSPVFDFAYGLCWHAARLATFRGSPRQMPSSVGLLVLLMLLSVLLEVFEQTVRGQPMEAALGAAGLIAFGVFTCAYIDGEFDVQVASALFLASLPIEAALTITKWVPLLKWPLSVWGAAAMLAVMAKRKERTTP